ncbi:hypothetical protein [Sphingomonas endolithica]|uniref:hypothetical protein n=1 Tax=Sphingomonas endolithica TaxID=2972485 RepID=UPI0021B08C5D|nr:hypothetical protein [Sphingomonas sp. ZFBP2030]
MSDHSTPGQLYELGRALLDEHGPSYVGTIQSFAEGVRTEGRMADADEAMLQCDRMHAILLSNRDLVVQYCVSHGQAGDPWSAALAGELERRGIDTCSGGDQ